MANSFDPSFSTLFIRVGLEVFSFVYPTIIEKIVLVFLWLSMWEYSSRLGSWWSDFLCWPNYACAWCSPCSQLKFCRQYLFASLWGGKPISRFAIQRFAFQNSGGFLLQLALCMRLEQLSLCASWSHPFSSKVEKKWMYRKSQDREKRQYKSYV